MAKRIVLGIVAAAATVTIGLAGCSGDKSSTGASSSAPGPVGNKVVVDGQAQNVAGPISCTQVNGNTSIGFGDPSTGVGAVVSNADPPVVQAVGLGNLNGATLGYSAGAPDQGNVQATKSGNSYTIKGTATGADAANPDQAVSKPFEMDVTCP
ncbi:lipoprotein LpqH [Candidatus Mycobacterium wuenschmannii]|uniref:Lipoprotein LpqH n=1 Tax=Candidatus Mycobacterium wuenschmannii TaxID=3027808 RepID=A0ABY8VZT3_9MYCO|nr:lipoprotein LpqH [Candidatus Mycobacterium wuenschmannii]WIM88480.1 lipoprotein LpqH [Candidatus Mycobacterium wuenschmannii]